MAGSFDIQSFFKSVSSSQSEPPAPSAGQYSGPNHGPPPPGFAPPGHMHHQQHLQPPQPFPFSPPQHFQGVDPAGTAQGPNSAGANLMALLRGPPPPSGPQLVNPGAEVPNKFNEPPPQDIAAPVPMRPTDSAAPTAPPLSFAPSSPPAAASKPSWFKGKAKKGTGRVLSGTHVVYDIEKRLPGETQPQLEVHTISKVPLEYRLEVGREIGVNRNYICYGMKTGSVRILSQVEDAKVLLKEHTQRLTDLAIFAEDVNLLASTSSDGRVFLHEVVGRGKKDTRARPIMGLQFPPEGGALHVAWNPRQQEHLAIVYGNSFYLAEVSRLQQHQAPPQENQPAPIMAVDPASPPEGLRLVGVHDDVILDVSFSAAGDRIASASKDGRVKVWGGEGDKCLSELNPHSGEAVSSVRFVAGPGGTGDVVMVTGGPANREIKLWTAGGGEESASSLGGWQCVQTVELTSSSIEDAFFNHLHIDHRSGLVFLANTLRNSLYVLNLKHGSPARFDYLAEFSFTAPILSFTTLNEGAVNGDETVEIYTVQPEKIQRYALDALLCRPPPPEEAEPASQMVSAPAPLSPLLLSQLNETPPSAQKPETPSAPSAEKHSPTGVEEPSAPKAPEGLEGLAPPPGVSSEVTREFSKGGHVNLGVGSKGLVQNLNELKKQGSKGRTTSPTKQRGLPAGELDATEKPEAAKVEAELEPQGQQPPVEKVCQAEASKEPAKPSAMLLSPSSLALLTGQASGEQQLAPTEEKPSGEKEVKAVLEKDDKPKSGRQNVGSPPKPKGGNNTKWAPKGAAAPEVVSSAPAIEGLSYEDVMKGVASKKESKKEPTKVQAAPPANAAAAVLAVPPVEKREVPSLDGQAGPLEGDAEKKRKGKEKEKAPAQAEAEIAAKAERLEDVKAAFETGGGSSEPVSGEGLVDPAALTAGGFILGGPTKGKKKNKGGNQATPLAPPQAEATPPPSALPVLPPSGGVLAPPQVESADVLQQILAAQRQLGGNMTTALGKEGKRIEAALGLRLEKVIKANAEAQLARAEEERVKREKAERQRMDAALQAITGALSRDLPALVEKSVKKELAVAAPALSKLLSPAVEKAVQEALVKGDGNKDLSQLEKTVGAKLEAALSRQVQAQFQTTLKAALQESLRTSFQGLLLPSFENATRAMFEQIEGAVRGGMAEHVQNAQQGGVALAAVLQETITSASALVTTLQSEIAEGQRKLIALAEASGKQRTTSLSKQVNGGLPDGAISLQHVEESLDPTKELSRFIAAGKYEEAFLKALNAFDVPMVTWLCNQIDPSTIFGAHPLPLSQGVLLSLVSQLGSDLSKDTQKKLDWISQAVLAINPEDPLLAPHMRPYLEQLYQSVHAQLQKVPAGGDVSRSMRTIIHVVNSLLTSCK